MAHVSLCLIAKDEERMLPGCLESVRGVVDEIVLVDTGSTDRTRELARAAGARVLERPWDDDFAAPRNLAAAHATGDWILPLDADERLAPGAGVALRRALRRATFDVGLVRCHNADAPDAPAGEVLSGARRAGPPALLPRVVRRAPGLRWTGRIHESVLEWAAARGGRIAALEVDLVHLGYSKEIWDGRGKRARNLALLRRRAEDEPGSVIALGYLAAELLALGQAEEAGEIAERAWAALDRQPRHRSIRRLAVVRAALAVRRGDAAVALEAVDRAEAAGGPNPDLPFFRACALEISAGAPGAPGREERLVRAAAELRRALALLEGGVFDQVIYAQRARALARLGAVELRAGRAEAARAAFRAARTPARPADALAPAEGIEAAAGEAEALVALGRAGEALAALEPVLAAGGPPRAWAAAARAAHALGALDDARLFLARARAAAAA
ncbi:glycosyl transferase family 2 [Anaeromyxobacter sp. K]|uniref:glycosyltransferase family 2 protein n=1 Tax=Anaeromyxobacter sp. (strain K) TaxID=447217 RepID=UPI00017BE1DE|nr:glycosyltransferase [Anaeromyxobacter sp. K]ACG73746.1 glycosyl transferase family 2 [Anaeromyxobacter sp. K]